MNTVPPISFCSQRTAALWVGCASLLLAACAKPAPPRVPVAVPAAALLAPAPAAAPVVPLADTVHTGRMSCELGQFIAVEESVAQLGHYTVTGKGFQYHMQRVPTTTGAVRLEDSRAGVVWLQIANKSMLMNQKQGRRMVDDCRSPQQQLVAEQLRRNPQGGLLDAPRR